MYSFYFVHNRQDKNIIKEKTHLAINCWRSSLSIILLQHLLFTFVPIGAFGPDRVKHATLSLHHFLFPIFRLAGKSIPSSRSSLCSQVLFVAGNYKNTYIESCGWDNSFSVVSLWFVLTLEPAIWSKTHRTPCDFFAACYREFCFAPEIMLCICFILSNKLHRAKKSKFDKGARAYFIEKI